jgi:hypothetical protein
MLALVVIHPTLLKTLFQTDKKLERVAEMLANG